MLNYYDISAAFFSMTRPFAHISDDATRSLIPDEKPANRNPVALILAADEDFRCLFKTLLEIWQYDIEEAETLEDADRIADRKRPDVVLMDTGRVFSESLLEMQNLRKSEKLENIPFILFSGHGQKHIRQTALDAGATGFCVKPVNFDHLQSLLNTLF